MIDKEKVLKGLECCKNWKCHSYECPYWKEDKCLAQLMADAQELIESLEATRPTTSVLPGTTYQRLMAIKEELEAKNNTLTTEVRELRRLTESLSNLCQNLLKRLAAYET